MAVDMQIKTIKPHLAAAVDFTTRMDKMNCVTAFWMDPEMELPDNGG